MYTVFQPIKGEKLAGNLSTFACLLRHVVDWSRKKIFSRRWFNSAVIFCLFVVFNNGFISRLLRQRWMWWDRAKADRAVPPFRRRTMEKKPAKKKFRSAARNSERATFSCATLPEFCAAHWHPFCFVNIFRPARRTSSKKKGLLVVYTMAACACF